MPAPTIVFDLDGTLVDTAPDLVDTLNVVFAREGLPAVPYESARMMIGGGAKAMLARRHARTDGPAVRRIHCPLHRPHRRAVAALSRPDRRARCASRTRPPFRGV